MIVEHVFVTTHEQDAAFDSAKRMLATMGFSPRESDNPACESCGYSLKGIGLDLPCPECGTARPGSRRVTFARGKRAPSRAPSSFHEHPQVVMLEFDRGRVTAVLSLEMRTQKPHKLQTQMLTSLATSLEAAIAGEADAGGPAMAVQQRIARRANIRKWISRVIMAIVLLPIIIPLVMVITGRLK
ncbi:MAG: hypothetical protein ACOYN0_05410 [Phycisphaerales bacterium]